MATSVETEQAKLQKLLMKLRQNPNSYEDNMGVAAILTRGCNPFIAATYFKNALNIKQTPEALLGLASSYNSSGLVEDAMALTQSAIKLIPDGQKIKERAYDLLITSSAACPSYDQQKILELSQEFTQKYYKIQEYQGEKKKSEKIKLALVSPDLHTHPVGIYLASFIKHFNKDDFEIYAYYNNGVNDAISTEIKEHCYKWTNTVELSDSQLFKEIQADGIDIALDLAGYTKNNRMHVLAQKPAPINVAWMGYYNTTGNKAIDYILADANIIPESEDKFYSEKIQRLAKSYMPTELTGMSTNVNKESPFEKNGYITFGTLNHVRKANKEVIDLWGKILAQVPESKLLMKGIMLDDQLLQKYLRSQFAQYDIAPGRIIIEGRCTRDEAMEAYNRMDIVLDTFPFGGGLTSVENLLMSAPLVTWHGDRFMCRVSSSALKQIGCEELIAYTHEDYVKIAVELAQDKERIKNYRHTLKDKMLNSPANAKAFAGHFQDALKDIYKENFCS